MSKAKRPSPKPTGSHRSYDWKVFDKNAMKYVVMWVSLAAISCLTGNRWWLALIPVVLLVFDITYFVFGIAAFDPEEVIARGYQWSGVFNESLWGEGLDYGFNLYDGDYKKSRDQAQNDKFEFLWKSLELESGMSILDVGCGCGDLLNYFRSKGLKVTGINITYEQAAICWSRDLDVIWSNWKTVLDSQGNKDKLLGKFDAITFMDTIEHYCPMQYWRTPRKQDDVYQQMFYFAARVLKTDSPSRRLFTSCLHMRYSPARPRTIKCVDLTLWDKLKMMWHVYILDKFHSGCYPGGYNDQLTNNARPYFNLVDRTDRTKDYMMTSLIAPEHFGVHKVHKMNVERMVYFATMMFIDPNFVHRLIWYFSSGWMKQFEDEDVDKSLVQLWWLTMKAQPLAKAEEEWKQWQEKKYHWRDEFYPDPPCKTSIAILKPFYWLMEMAVTKTRDLDQAGVIPPTKAAQKQRD